MSGVTVESNARPARLAEAGREQLGHAWLLHTLELERPGDLLLCLLAPVETWGALEG